METGNFKKLSDFGRILFLPPVSIGVTVATFAFAVKDCSLKASIEMILAGILIGILFSFLYVVRPVKRLISSIDPAVKKYYTLISVEDRARLIFLKRRGWTYYMFVTPLVINMCLLVACLFLNFQLNTIVWLVSWLPVTIVIWGKSQPVSLVNFLTRDYMLLYSEGYFKRTAKDVTEKMMNEVKK